MKNKILVVIILFCVCIICGAVLLLNKNENNEQEIDNNQTINSIVNTNNESDTNTTNIESENTMISNIKVIMDGDTCNATLEDNETAQSFVNMLPQEFSLHELNGNEKYIYLDTILPTNSYSPKQIEAGDIMLYGNNCLVVFYKTFSTTYSYTKIGHINDLPDLDGDDIVIKFEK